MASGHVNRTKRPNTWLHRPTLQNVKKALANPEPSTHGTKRTCRSSQRMSAMRGKAQVLGHRQTDSIDPSDFREDSFLLFRRSVRWRHAMNYDASKS
jgi:hypothetical protein